jgi:hypothetical protein
MTELRSAAPDSSNFMTLEETAFYWLFNTAALLWSLGRIGAREPFYGPLNSVVSPARAGEWVERLIGPRHTTSDRQLAVMLLARRTGDRYRDVEEPLRNRVVNWLSATGAPEHFVTLAESGGELEDREASLVFGESLPIGLRLHG